VRPWDQTHWQALPRHANLTANLMDPHERVRRQLELILVLRVLPLAALGFTTFLVLAPTRVAAQTNAVQTNLPQTNAAPTAFIDEVKIGALGHDVGFLTHHVESGPDVNLEMLFKSPDWLSVIGSPRPHIGADINTAGNTSDGYFGLTWGVTLIQNVFGAGDGIFANGSLGGAIQDGFVGSKGGEPPPGRKFLGSVALFRESAELGYQITPTISVSALLDHISNADLAPRNAGITSAGARLGFKF
jgi:lipid A 3-O-deacylase